MREYARMFVHVEVSIKDLSSMTGSLPEPGTRWFG